MNGCTDAAGLKERFNVKTTQCRLTAVSTRTKNENIQAADHTIFNTKREKADINKKGRKRENRNGKKEGSRIVLALLLTWQTHSFVACKYKLVPTYKLCMFKSPRGSSEDSSLIWCTISQMIAGTW